MKRIYLILVTAIMLCTSLTSCKEMSSGSVYGIWKEYRADDPSDDYLISQLRFNQDGTGSFTLLDGSNVRNKFTFTWKMDNYGNIKTYTFDGNSSTYQFNNGLITEQSAFGSVVYKKKTPF